MCNDFATLRYYCVSVVVISIYAAICRVPLYAWVRGTGASYKNLLSIMCDLNGVVLLLDLKLRLI